MVKTIRTEGGPFLIGRRRSALHQWDLYEEGFMTEAAALAAIEQMPKEYQYGVLDVRTVEGAKHHVAKGTA